MDVHPTPFPGSKTQSVRSKYKKVLEEPKPKRKAALPNGQKRVFGTTRNPNVPTKTTAAPGKPPLKPSVPKSHPKSVQNQDMVAIPVTEIPPICPKQPEAIQTAGTPSVSPTQPEIAQAAEIILIPVEETALLSQNEPKQIQTLEIAEIPEQTKSKETTESTPVPVTDTAKKSPAENKARVKKKSVCFPESAIREKSSKNSQGRETDGQPPRTPVRSPFSLAKPRLSGTPYQSAEKCSHCRFDRLETSSYWLSQIRLAESVGKHSVSAAFFGLALDSKAEPYRSLRVELKKYLGRHECVSDETEWKDVSRKYGLLKDGSEEADVNAVTMNIGDHEMQNKEPKDQPKEEAAASESHTEKMC